MAVSPILLSRVPFDATAEHRMEFTYDNAPQVFGHRLIIKNNATNVVVYDSKEVASQKWEVTIPPNTLTNGET